MRCRPRFAQRVFETVYWGKPAILKQRFEKKYRHPTLDAKLTKQRLSMEVRGMLKARKLGLCTPGVLLVDAETNSIIMEKIPGVTVKEWLKVGQYSPKDLEEVLCKIGRLVAKLHDGGMVHGDLTTSNLVIREGKKELVFIDFGLSFNSVIPEDKAVDIYVMERAFLNAHADKQGLFDTVLSAYSKDSKWWSSTFNRYADGASTSRGVHPHSSLIVRTSIGLTPRLCIRARYVCGVSPNQTRFQCGCEAGRGAWWDDGCMNA